MITDTQERTSALKLAREFISQVRRHRCGFALFSGRPGTGKTRIACNIIGELQHQDALYVRQSALTAFVRAGYDHHRVKSLREDLREAEQRLSQGYTADMDPDCYWQKHKAELEAELEDPLPVLQSVGFLVLDEIGCGPMGNDDRLWMDELVKHRYDHRKPTMFLTNLPLTGSADAPGLKEYLGDAITDRIRDGTGNGKFILQLQGESYRREKGHSYLNPGNSQG